MLKLGTIVHYKPTEFERTLIENSPQYIPAVIIRIKEDNIFDLFPFCNKYDNKPLYLECIKMGENTGEFNVQVIYLTDESTNKNENASQ